MAHKRSFRRSQRRRERTEPESPRLLLSTIPFVAMMALLAVLAVAIMIAAFPITQPHEFTARVAQREQGVAPKGWFQEAQREFHG